LYTLEIPDCVLNLSEIRQVFPYSLAQDVTMAIRTGERDDLRSFYGEFVVLFAKVMRHVVDVQRG
jgi:hypothetical protein